MSYPVVKVWKPHLELNPSDTSIYGSAVMEGEDIGEELNHP